MASKGSRILQSFFERVSKRFEVFMDVETDTSQIELVFDQKFLDVSLHRYIYLSYSDLYNIVKCLACQTG